MISRVKSHLFYEYLLVVGGIELTIEHIKGVVRAFNVVVVVFLLPIFEEGKEKSLITAWVW